MSIKTNLTLDIAIFGAFLTASNPALTGLPIHEWLSAALAATLLVHLLFHLELGGESDPGVFQETVPRFAVELRSG
jgi:hypothetical protein